MLKKVEVLVEHEDCWTFHMPFNAYTINLEVYPHKNYLRSRILVENLDKDMVNSMKNHRSVVRLNKVSKFTNNNSYYIDFLNVYKGSITGILYDREVLILGNTITEKKEKWSFVTSSKSIREILDDIRNTSKVVDYKVTDYNPMLHPSLTDIEKRVIIAAFNQGYLDYPRRASAEELAEKLKMSKVTFLYHLRNSQKKLMKYFIENML